jgi:TRAP-type C4-dicarboxylate transport system substrate-binding protein
LLRDKPESALTKDGDMMKASTLLGQSSRRARLLATGTAAAAALAMTGCAGSAGSAGASEGGGDGFAYGASQEEIDAVIEDLEPTTLVFQSPAQSPESHTAPSNIAFAEEVEKRSNGKISVDLLYGHPIAGYAEIYDALVDGRVDISYTNPAYDPDKFDGFDDLVSITSSLPESPMVGELVAIASLLELAWTSEEINQDFADQGLVPVVPVHPPGAYFAQCTTPGTSLDDWEGRVVRVGSTVHSGLVQSIGGSPVSMEYVETYEALQRNTIDCTTGAMTPALDGGFFETAPNLQYTGDMAMPRVFGSMLAGSKYDQMPTAYKQIIFDAWQAAFLQSTAYTVNDNKRAVEEANKRGGQVEQFSDEVLELVAGNRQESMDRVVEAGRLGDDIETRMVDTVEKWENTLAELGYEDGGTLTDMDQWFSEEEFDSEPFVSRLYEEVISKHRPS